MLALVAGAVSLLAQGERFALDPVLRTPGGALAMYWEALQNNDAEGLWACSADPSAELPFPGMTWYFPPTRALSLEDLLYLPVDENRVLVSYQVRFRLLGSGEERVLTATTELLKLRGEWRVAQPLAEAGLLNGRPLPSRFDS